MPVLPPLQENDSSVYYGTSVNSRIWNTGVRRSGQSENLHADNQSLGLAPIPYPQLGGQRRVNDSHIQHTSTPGA